MMRVIVTGAAGQLAGALRMVWPGDDLYFPDESLLDLSNPESIHRMIRGCSPAVVLNCGAFTQVDQCETDHERADRINGEAVGWLAEACNQVGALLVQISTDYVFDGTSTVPYREDDIPVPRSAYGKSKLLGERMAARAQEHLIVRTAWLYEAWGRNFFRTMVGAAREGRKLRVVDDQWGSPTSCRALARQIRGAVNEGWRGIVHATCSGQTTWYGFAREIFLRMGIEADLTPCATSEYPLPAPRPAYSVLDGSKRSQLGTDLMPPWEEALSEVIKAFNL